MIHCIEVGIVLLVLSGVHRTMSDVNPRRVRSSPHFCPAETAKRRSLSTYEAVHAKVDDWIDYYNNDRYQWELLKLSPKEYYQYLQTGVYPLPVYESKKKQ